jgi:threonine dehydrogenase-like Zn-dependent dehydrogenase
MAPLRLVTLDEPSITRPGWARLRPRLSGICGSDLGMLTGSTSLYFSSLVSMPFVPGHEVVGDLIDDCDDLPAGTRVVMDSVLACAARGIEPCSNCAAGATNRCDRITVGHVAVGIQTGYCADTGGGWGQVMMVHRSQLHVVPDDLSDERAVLAEPLACAVRLAERAEITPGDSVLVSGAGAVGLFAALALRELTPAGRITVVAKHSRQREQARALGATDVVRPDEAMRAVRRATGAHKVAALPVTTGELANRVSATVGGELLLGGVDVAIDCVGSASSLDLALRCTRAGGRVVLSGMPGPGVDLSPAWFRELTVAGTYASAGRAFDSALMLAGQAPLDDMISGRYPLGRWREALDHAHSVGRLGGVKVCFDTRRRA